MRLRLVLLFLSLAHPSLAGCYQRRLCCPGRNNTCKVSTLYNPFTHCDVIKAVDDGIDHLPTVSPPPQDEHRNKVPSNVYRTPYYEANGDGYDLIYPTVYDAERHHEKIGKLVMPDVIELDGVDAHNIYETYGPHDDEVPARLVHPAQTTVAPSRLTHFIFGKQMGPDETPEEHVKYQQPHNMLIRYSVLSQHLPLTVSASHHSQDVHDHSYSIQYLEAAPVDCYCDESCLALGDCCSDYTFMCPPSDCQVDEWNTWSACRADNGRCGIGVQQRLRSIVHQRQRGGAECPPLKEMRTCFKECPKRNLADITTVALLLDYRHNETRRRVMKNNVFWDQPSLVSTKLSTATYYCVTYEIGWVNRNCISPKIRKRLYRGNRICAECQPEAQLHRNNGRCASDLEDGDEGFWKLIGPKSCNGIWRRLQRTENCHCSRDLPLLDPFLIV